MELRTLAPHIPGYLGLEDSMAEHLEDVPKGRGLPTIDDMKRWQAAFDAIVPGGNASELVGFRIVDTGDLMAICRRKPSR